jgi:GTP-binding protein
MRAQTEAALEGATVALFVIDARAGLTPLDEEIGRHLHQSSVPVVLLANKAEGRAGDAGLFDPTRLVSAIRSPFPLSTAKGSRICSRPCFP